jgi:hypothetical protein
MPNITCRRARRVIRACHNKRRSVPRSARREFDRNGDIAFGQKIHVTGGKSVRTETARKHARDLTPRHRKYNQKVGQSTTLGWGMATICAPHTIIQQNQSLVRGCVDFGRPSAQGPARAPNANANAVFPRACAGRPTIGHSTPMECVVVLAGGGFLPAASCRAPTAFREQNNE